MLEASRQSPDIGPGGKPLPSRVLDGRPVLHKKDLTSELERTLSPQPHFEEEEEEEEKDQELTSRINKLLCEKRQLVGQLSALRMEKNHLEAELGEQQVLLAQSNEENSDFRKDIELLRSESSHVSTELARAEQERDNAIAATSELQQKLSDCEQQLAEVSE